MAGPGLDDLAGFADLLPWPMPIEIDLRMHAPPRRAEFVGVLRARPGVAVMARAREGSFDPVFVGATGDLRACVRSRLSGEGPRHRGNLAGVTDIVLACEVGSGFEADWAQAVLSTYLTPNAAKLAVEARRGVFLVLDPGADVPVRRVTDLADCGGCIDPSTVIGPFGRRGAAEVYGRLLDERFELCREPVLLAQRPNASACAYKEMGRCPAPCDGSEPMEAYRGRAHGALAFARRPIGEAIDVIRSAIGDETRALHFERAGELKNELESIEMVGGRAYSWVTTLDRFGVLGVVPAGRAGWARLIVHGRCETRYVADVDARRAEEALRACWGWLTQGETGGEGFDLTTSGVDAIGLVCRHLFTKRKTRSTFLRLDPAPDRAEVLRAIRRAARVVTDEPDSIEGVISQGDRA